MRTRKIDRLTVEVYESTETLIPAAARILLGQLKSKPRSVVGLATGSTFVPFYDFVARHYMEEGVSFGQVVTFNLDEYFPISRKSADSYHTFMWEHLFSRVNIRASNTHIPDGEAENPSDEARSFEQNIVAAGGIDLQLLGMGRNGHIGFNEPGTPFDSRTHLAMLTESTINANAPLFSETTSVPVRALTMGIGTILDARRIVLIAYGSEKADAVRKSLAGGVTADVPASSLRTHADAMFLIDERAAEGLPQ